MQVFDFRKTRAKRIHLGSLTIMKTLAEVLSRQGNYERPSGCIDKRWRWKETVLGHLEVHCHTR